MKIPSSAVLAVLAALLPVIAKADDYILSLQGDMTPAITQQLAQAGATITGSVPEVGVIFVSAGRTFAPRARSINGIQFAAPDVKMSNAPPTQVVDFEYPSASGDGSVRHLQQQTGPDFRPLQWGLQAIKAPQAHAKGIKGEGVVVAVLDGGFSLLHPDLRPNILDAVSFVNGEDVAFDPNRARSTFSHGSHVAGIIAAAETPPFGILGVAPKAQLMLVKVLNDAGSGSTASLLSGIVYAALNGADVINMSLGTLLQPGGRDAADLKNTLTRVISYARRKGVTVIAAAGNDALDFDRTGSLIHLPSSCPGVISVSALAPVDWWRNRADLSYNFDNLASYSNFGTSGISFGAPGGDDALLENTSDESCEAVIPGVAAPLMRSCFVFDLVFSCSSANGYVWTAGTSVSAPHVAGVAALIIGKNGGSMDPVRVEAALRATSDDLGKPGKDAIYGQGRVNAGRV